MTTKTKKKMCWNCEGDVALTALQCPFCGVSLDVVAMEKDPPYKMGKEETIPASPYAQKAEEPVQEEETELANDPKSLILSLAFLLAGAAFGLFGIVLWLFADATGHLNLQWNAEYWFVYLLISLPLLYLGWKAIQSDGKV